MIEKFSSRLKRDICPPALSITTLKLSYVGETIKTESPESTNALDIYSWIVSELEKY